MHGLAGIAIKGSAIAIILGLGLTSAGCANQGSLIGNCEDISAHKLRQGTALAWEIGDTQYLGYGVYSCDVPSTVKVAISQDTTGSYEFGEVVATFGETQTEFLNFGPDLKDNKEFFESSNVIGKNARLQLDSGQKIQFFVGAKPTRDALLYGVERHYAKITFSSADGKVIRVFHPSNDIGILAQLPKAK